MSWISFKNITKRFPGVLALNDVSLEVQRGHCHALMGENGAGKSTLGKILAGVYTADGGSIELDGKTISPRNPLEARRLGIAMVHQELAFCPNLTVGENLCLGALPSHGGWLDRDTMRRTAQKMLAEIEAPFDVDAPMGTLTTAQEQLAQIAAALGTGAQVIDMDEPTSSLSSRESDHLFALIGRLKARGITLLYVSHRMEEIFRLCDSISVLRDGRHVSTGPIAQTSPSELIRQMVGRNVEVQCPKHLDQPLGRELLRVEGLSSPGKFQDVSFKIHAGEVLGFAGLIGAGRSEVALALFGLDPSATGRVWIEGRELPLGSIEASMQAGLGLLPEDRKRQGLVLGLNCRENVSLASLPQWSRFGWMQRRAERDMVSAYAEQLRVRTPDLETAVAGLSGGNQQKLALAKWLARRCGILIVDEPTRGVDVGAKAEMHALIDDQACKGAGVMLISSEMPEVLALSRRITVMRGGRIAGEVSGEAATQESLMGLMAGINNPPPMARRANGD